MAESALDFIFPTSSALPDVLDELWNLGIKSVYVEGGATILSQFFQDGLVDRLHLFMAPVILGAGAGQSWTKGLKLSSIQDKILLKHMQTKTLGTDIYFTGRL